MKSHVKKYLKKYGYIHLTYDGSEKRRRSIGAFLALVGKQPVISICTTPGSDNNLKIKKKFDDMFEECEIPTSKRGLVMMDNASWNSKYTKDY
jgi:hypothetical protein